MPLVSVVGAGRVGTEVAHLVLLKNLADVVLVDVVPGRAEGEALDLAHELAILGIDRDVRGTTRIEEIAGSDIVVITAGFPRGPGMSREELIHKNASIVEEVSKKVAELCPKAKIIVVTNPVDAMTYVAWRTSGFDRRRVIGFGPLLDSARLRHYLAKELRKSILSIQPLVIGQHGKAMVPALSATFVEGLRAKEILPEDVRKRIVEKVIHAGEEIIKLRGYSAHHAPAAGVALIVESTLRGDPRYIPCIAVLDGEYGVRDIAMGVPCIISSRGIERIIEIELDEEEKYALQNAVKAIRELLSQLPPHLRPTQHG